MIVVINVGGNFFIWERFLVGYSFLSISDFIYIQLKEVPVRRRCWRRDDPCLLLVLLLPHGHDLLLLLSQTLHLCLQEAQRGVQPLDGTCVGGKVGFS